MTAFVLLGIAAGPVIVLACGDSPKDAEPSLFVLKGGQVLAIFADRPQAVQVAAKALPRF